MLDDFFGSKSQTMASDTQQIVTPPKAFKSKYKVVSASPGTDGPRLFEQWTQNPCMLSRQPFGAT
jgi:hypothetical protein